MVFRKIVSALLVVLLLCSCSMPSHRGKSPSESELMSQSAKMLDSQFQMVRSIIIAQEGVEGFKLEETLTGTEIARGVLSEEKGEEQLGFLYLSDKFETTEEVYAAAGNLIPKEQLEEIKRIAEGVERSLESVYQEGARALSDTQRVEFYKDLRALVVKSVVLLTAAVVYALLPDYMIFGKVSAASAMAIAAGVLSSTLLAIVEWKDSGVLSTSSDNFEAWLIEVTKEPTAAWALASGMIATGKAVNTNPVTTAVSIAVFALYGVTDDLSKMLKSYNFKIPT